MYQILVNYHVVIILLILAFSLLVLSKASDLLVNNAVKLSEKLGMNEIVIGATIVSLGTTMPELSTSVISALQGNGSFAIGNAVGSIITNTSLILGIGAMFGAIPVDKRTSNKLSVLIVVVGVFIISAIPYKIGDENGRITQWIGIMFVLFLFVYFYFIIKEEQKNKTEQASQRAERGNNINIIIISIISIIASALIVAVSASSLVASAEILAERIGIPDVIISSTLVAFGTSVPELSTCISAAKNKHGGLAIGNIIGANILNILFVIGLSATLSRGGLSVENEFYRIHLAALLIILSAISYFAYNRKVNEINKKEGTILVLFYIAYLLVNFFVVI